MNAIFDLPEMRAQVHVWTVEEYEKLDDDPVFVRTELVRGSIVNKMSKTSLHEYLTGEIAGYFRRAARAGLVVRQEASLRLADSVPEPDVAVVAGRPVDFRDRKPVTAELVIEIAVASLALDREKASLYAEAEVTQYWIVLAEAGQVEVYRQPVGGVYQTVPRGDHRGRRGDSGERGGGRAIRVRYATASHHPLSGGRGQRERVASRAVAA